LESWLALVILLATSLFAFFGPDLGLAGFAVCVAPFPVLVWVGTRLGPRGATVALFCIVVIATTATGMGSGPFILGTTTEAMILLWAYSIFMGITAFTMATVVEQRNYADRRYRFEEAERIRTEQHKVLLVERERLTREMHDGLGGQLVSVLSMVERGHAGQNEVAEAIRRAIDDIRIVIDSLDPNMTILSTSLGKLRGRLEPLLRRNGIQLSWSIDDMPGLDTFSPEAALHVLRIIQEAVTNTLRHASADRVEVIMTSSGADQGKLRLSICDDGQGLSPLVPSGGRGIKNIKSRAKELGAEVSIEGTSSGTKVDLAIPFPR
jgi:signal transduction histidine kinase